MARLTREQAMQEILGNGTGNLGERVIVVIARLQRCTNLERELAEAHNEITFQAKTILQMESASDAALAEAKNKIEAYKMQVNSCIIGEETLEAQLAPGPCGKPGHTMSAWHGGEQHIAGMAMSGPAIDAGHCTLCAETEAAVQVAVRPIQDNFQRETLLTSNLLRLLETIDALLKSEGHPHDHRSLTECKWCGVRQSIKDANLVPSTEALRLHVEQREQAAVADALRQAAKIGDDFDNMDGSVFHAKYGHVDCGPAIRALIPSSAGAQGSSDEPWDCIGGLVDAWTQPQGVTGEGSKP